MIQLSIPAVAPARSQLAAVLKMLIENDFVSERDTPFNGFRSRISDLRLDYGLDVRFAWVEYTNQFGRKGRYRKHFLLSIDKDKAIEVYNRINSL